MYLIYDTGCLVKFSMCNIYIKQMNATFFSCLTIPMYFLLQEGRGVGNYLQVLNNFS